MMEGGLETKDRIPCNVGYTGNLVKHALVARALIYCPGKGLRDQYDTTIGKHEQDTIIANAMVRPLR